MTKSPIEQSPYLTTKEAADFLRLKPRTLENMRWVGGGPQYHKHGGRVLYHIDELRRWSEARAYCSTSGE